MLPTSSSLKRCQTAVFHDGWEAARFPPRAAIRLMTSRVYSSCARAAAQIGNQAEVLRARSWSPVPLIQTGWALLMEEWEEDHRPAGTSWYAERCLWQGRFLGGSLVSPLNYPSPFCSKTSAYHAGLVVLAVTWPCHVCDLLHVLRPSE